MIPSRGLGQEFCLQTPELSFSSVHMVPSTTELPPQVLLEARHQQSRIRIRRTSLGRACRSSGRLASTRRRRHSEPSRYAK